MIRGDYFYKDVPVNGRTSKEEEGQIVGQWLNGLKEREYKVKGVDVSGRKHPYCSSKFLYDAFVEETGECNISITRFGIELGKVATKKKTNKFNIHVFKE